MKEIVDFGPADLLPSMREVLAAQGVPHGAPVSERVSEQVERALEIFSDAASPRAVVREVDLDAFEEVARGRGANAADAVVYRIARGAEGLALFAGTVGEDVAERVEDAFARRELALAAALDAVASLAADRISTLLAGAMLAELRSRGAAGERSHGLGYSPGYCGWHLTGQRALFQALRPERVGITLSEECLMTPVKSVSGVLAVGPTAAHDFEPGFSYCAECRSRSCQRRILDLHGRDAAVVGAR